ncbi:hypothetical protein LEP1GSC052_1462 [Leptospira kmetyi serovar Malaysia str. Bejo-Iso9]|nr:hypothetical protein LEP1GSC052_1462 [Leptospira kmetyi serovar Malaysia str. Bejo-Iso9]
MERRSTISRFFFVRSNLTNSNELTVQNVRGSHEDRKHFLFQIKFASGEWAEKGKKGGKPSNWDFTENRNEKPRLVRMEWGKKTPRDPNCKLQRTGGEF